MSQRQAFIEAAMRPAANLSALCRQYAISRKTAYKWLHRARRDGAHGLHNHSRRPQHSPTRTAAEVEARVVQIRTAHPAWGGRKIQRVLQDQGVAALPAPSTITAILRRHGLIAAQETQAHQRLHRFEREAPNQLWQMDFKGPFRLAAGGMCHPLVVLDDHSRYLLGLKACANETAATVQDCLTTIFGQYGLPEGMLMDNGSAWGFDADAHHTILTAWLIRLGIRVAHGRPYHPQTQGKTERLNRTLAAEVLHHQELADLTACQTAFDAWQAVYNHLRPHDALALQPPSSRYQPSPRPFPSRLPEVTYLPGDEIRMVDLTGNIFVHNRRFHISAAFRHQPVALRPTGLEGEFSVYYCSQQVAMIRLR
jgi:transposase InsO family protein